MSEQTRKQKKTRRFRRPVVLSSAGLVFRSAGKFLSENRKKPSENGNVSVCDEVFRKALCSLQPETSRLGLNLENGHYSTEMTVTLPEEQKSRHLFFALLAKNFRASGKPEYLEEFRCQFEKWNRGNPFPQSPAWTDTAEIAFRIHSWCMALGFLSGSEETADLCEELRVGILNMTAYLCDHHVLLPGDRDLPAVEMCAVFEAGILFGEERWVRVAADNITKVISAMFYSDGTGSEKNLRVQGLTMEALALSMRLMKIAGMPVPEVWTAMLDKMCRFVNSCRGARGETVSFGDDDGSRLLDLAGGEDPDGFFDYYAYVLALCSMALEKNYAVPAKDSAYQETLDWLYHREAQIRVFSQKCYMPPAFDDYPRAGITLVHSGGRKMILVTEHPAGSIAQQEAQRKFGIEGIRLYADGCEMLHTEPGAAEERIGREILLDRDDRFILTEKSSGADTSAPDGPVSATEFTAGPWCSVSVHGNNVHIHGIGGTEVLLHFREGAENVRQVIRKVPVGNGQTCETTVIQAEYRRKLVTSLTAR